MVCWVILQESSLFNHSQMIPDVLFPSVLIVLLLMYGKIFGDRVEVIQPVFEFGIDCS